MKVVPAEPGLNNAAVRLVFVATVGGNSCSFSSAPWLVANGTTQIFRQRLFILWPFVNVVVKGAVCMWSRRGRVVGCLGVFHDAEASVVLHRALADAIENESEELSTRIVAGRADWLVFRSDPKFQWFSTDMSVVLIVEQ